jgi:cation diffusion facilitator CzcD-associated flavoprotein CzcO
MLSFPRSPRYVGSRVCNIHRESSSKIIKQVPVCILGGGPVGLLLSSQLSSYGINHCIVERRETPTKHPQAHFMNARTMEILQAHLPKTFNSVVHEMPPSETWRYGSNNVLIFTLSQYSKSFSIFYPSKSEILSIVTLSLEDISQELISLKKQIRYFGMNLLPM